MRSLFLATSSLACVALNASSAIAWHFESRLVDRIGNIDMPLVNDVQFEQGSTHRLRIQFAVFDDANGPAPSAGLVGWNVGTLSTTGGGTWTRTPGRLSPFNFVPNPIANGVPAQDPFTSLTQIDDVVGIQTFAWGCDGAGQPLPPPPPTIYGLNSFVSTYEISVLTPGAPTAMDVSWGGNRIGATSWSFRPELSQLPDCEAGTPGVALYFPFTTPPQSFSESLRIQVVAPSPGAGVIILAFGCGGLMRRRGEFVG